MLSNYNIIKILGQGGMGKVYLATHKTIHRKVAIKELLAEHAQNEHLRQRFRQEATLLGTLDHPYIIRLYDFIETPQKLYLVLEYTEGVSLEYLKQTKGKFSVNEIIEFFPKILQAISYAHTHHIIHRDLKPSNIMLEENTHIKILDFGIAKALQEEDNHLTRTGTRIGTIYYMSPEQIKGQEITPKSDIYALGVMLFELLIGYNPYENINSEYDISHKILHESLPLIRKINPEISDIFQKMIFRATAKNPKQRYQNAEEWLAEWEFLKENKQNKNTLLDVIGDGNTNENIDENEINNLFYPKKNANIELVIYENEDFEQIQKNTQNQNSIIENISLPESIILENTFGKITNKSLNFYQYKDLFEQGILTKLDLIDIQKIDIQTHREAGSGIFLLCVSMPFLLFSGYLFTILLFLLFFGVGLMCFLEFPLITIHLINQKKIKMKGWFYEYKDARIFVKKMNEIIKN